MSNHPDTDPDLVAAEYLQQKPTYEHMAGLVRLILERSLLSAGIAATCTARAKEVDSLLGKMARKRYTSLDRVGDRAGARVILRSAGDVEAVSAVVEECFVVRTRENVTARLKLNQFDYRGYHFQVSLRATDCDDIVEASCQCEIQVRTKAEDLWNDVSHELLYKSERRVPEKVVRRLHRLVALVEIFDEQVDAARAAIIDLSEDLTWPILSLLESQFRKVSLREFDRELSVEVVETLLPIFGEESREFVLGSVDEFCEKEKSKVAFILQAYEKSSTRNPFIPQPEMALIAMLLRKRRFDVLTAWTDRFSEDYLRDIATRWSIDLPDVEAGW